jgi:1-deoxy-D-xylulose-5-phosphate reductoisomerase
MRTLSVFGSTGSVGKSCLEVIRSLPESHFKILALVANDNYQELANQAVEFSVALVVIKNEQHYKALKELLSHTSIRVT